MFIASTKLTILQWHKQGIHSPKIQKLLRNGGIKSTREGISTGTWVLLVLCLAAIFVVRATIARLAGGGKRTVMTYKIQRTDESW